MQSRVREHGQPVKLCRLTESVGHEDGFRLRTSGLLYQVDVQVERRGFREGHCSLVYRLVVTKTSELPDIQGGSSR